MSKSRLNLLTVALFYFGMFGLSVWIDFSERIFRFAPFGPNFWSKNLKDLGIAVTAAAAVIVVSYLLVRFLPPMRGLGRFLAELLGSLKWTEAFAVAAFSALGEEFLFRGVIQHYLGIFPAALIFGALHTGPGRRFIPWTLFAFLVGLVLGYVYERTGNLLTSTAAHFLINFVNLLLLSRWAKEESIKD
ncbi:MAG: CPBP family intramembrane glutamic endopeptidase [Pseudomonadota bacterium]